MSSSSVSTTRNLPAVRQSTIKRHLQPVNMAAAKDAIKTQIKALIPGTKEHKARVSGDPAYHLGNVGSNNHLVHTGYGLTGKMHPKSTEAHEAKDHTKDKISRHVHVQSPKRGLHSHAAAPVGSSDAPGAQLQQQQQQQQQEAPGAAGEMLKGLATAPH